MNFSWWFANKIAFGKSSKNNLSTTIIRIGQIAVAIGIMVALITLSTGIGARKGIKQKLADFNGHITIKPYNSNLSFNSDSLSLKQDFYPNFRAVPEINHIQAIAVKGGIIRTKDNFSGVFLKGVGTDFDRVRFHNYITKGKFPIIGKTQVSNDVVIPEKIAKELHLDVDSSFVIYFSQNNGKPIYRRFQVSGLFSTDIKDFDDIYIIGDIKQVQRLNKWDSLTVGGFELFTDIEKLDEVALKVNENINFQLYAQSASTSFTQINDWIAIFDTNIFVVLFIMMIVVVINMVMVLLILILERTHSIGLLKTLGATNWRVRKIFIYYAVFIMIPGLVVGNVLGIGLLLIQKYFKIIKLPAENYYLSYAPVYLDIGYILILNICAIIISAIVLILPSYLISKITPNQAMKINQS
ncbi:ABC transporter permease [Moheibacter sediminis]|uniref:Lipoprotein-releasing system permease protein n=1 Tax=Moheibacter sediminis TaxID=1434700 RepID=A0A1W1Z0A9_9FLAO|nr:FtsX-like permease family protein [Moheibacter sediminis]SMC41897.1 lipoprotein-releasing system permease protein [Moheibacter sediminis]